MKHTTLSLICVMLALFAFSVCAFAANAAATSAPTKAAVSGCGSSTQGSTGGRSASSGAAPVASDPLKLTVTQKHKLASIDKRYHPRAQAMETESVQLRKEFNKLNSSSKADEQRLARVVRRLTYLQGEIFLWDRQRDRAKQSVYTAQQKTILAKSSGCCGSSSGSCGCGSSSGGCGGGGSSTASGNKGGN